MSDDRSNSIERPPRNLSQVPLGTRLYRLNLKRYAFSKKTLILLSIQLIPAVIVALSMIWQDLNGLEVFESTVDSVYLPLLLPLTTLFFGGPTVVDEVEGRTITYLTLRPLSRTTLYLSKLLTSITLAIAVTVLPILVLFGICALGGDGGMDGAGAMLGSAVATMTVGAITYTSIFALLGVVFSATLLPGIVYYVVFELIFGSVPIVELLSVKYHLHLLGGYEGDEPGPIRETLEGMLLDQPLDFDWWVGFGFAGLVAAGAVLLGAALFKNRQFHV